MGDSPSPVPSLSPGLGSLRTVHPPQVPQKSSLLTFLELCEVGYDMRINVLDDFITKHDDNMWALHEEEGVLTAIEVVKKIRFAASEDDGDLDLDKIFAVVEPLDIVAVKRERAQEESDDEPDVDDKPKPKMGMKLEDAIDCEDEANTIARPGAGAQQVCPCSRLEPLTPCLKLAPASRHAVRCVLLCRVSKVLRRTSCSCTFAWTPQPPCTCTARPALRLQRRPARAAPPFPPVRPPPARPPSRAPPPRRQKPRLPL